MKSNLKVARAVTAILGVSAAQAVLAAALPSDPSQAVLAAAPASNVASIAPSQLQPVIVTATRRAESTQDIPITVQALTGEALRRLNVEVLSDFVKDLPNVTTASLGPGQDTVIIRGVASTSPITQLQGPGGLFPNVGTYLDDQSTMLPGRDLDIYAVDLERIEVLEGPQGTLFGAGAEAGALRYITNKPKLDEWEVDVNAGRGVTAHGDPNSNENAVFNIPLLAGKLAARVVLFQDNQGGYINNLPATFSRSSTDLGIAEANGGVVPTNSETITNDYLSANHINPLTYDGYRVEALYKINDNWNALVTEMSQDMDAQGVFYEMPYSTQGAGVNDANGMPVGTEALPPLSVNLFNPSFNKDRFNDTALTVNGKVGPLSVVYDGSYLVRNVEQVQDYTSYARGRYAYYYQCVGVSYSALSGNRNATCMSPSNVWRDIQKNTNVQQELRVSTPANWRLRGIAGLFYDDINIMDDTAYQEKTLPNCSQGGATVDCFLPIQAFSPAFIPGVRDSTAAFVNDFTRVVRQRAAYTSVSYDIVPRALTITGGIRYFDMYTSEVGGQVGSFGCKQLTPTTYFGVCETPSGTDVTNQNPHSLVETGHLGRASLAWHIEPNLMVYYTYSQGYRPGGFNRGSSPELENQAGVPQFFTPLTYTSDILTNNEIGWKTLIFDGRLRFNGTLYNESWSNAQTSFYCPACGFGELTFNTNGPKYLVRGAELQLDAMPIRGLTIESGAAVNHGEQVNSPALIDNNPATSNYGQPITTRYVNGAEMAVLDPFGPRDSDLSQSPPFKASLRVRYDWAFGPYIAYVQGGAQHSSSSIASTAYFANYRQPSWTTYDASIGISKGDFTVSLVGENLTNENKSLFTTSNQFTLTETPMRPRVIEATFGYRWSHKD